MLREIKIVPLASESLGVRSMCFYVETPDVRVILDAGASLAPRRFGFPPHPREYEAIGSCREKISKAAERAEVVTLSHYHFDHHTPSFLDWCHNWCSAEVAKHIYDGKVVLTKNYRAKVNISQRRRGWLFTRTGGKYAERVEIADGRVFRFGDTKLKFSDPVFHGPKDSAQGWVLMTTIERNEERVLFAPDVQGPMHNPTLQIILAAKPQLIIIGGPPIYLAGFQVREEHVQQAMRNLMEVIKRVPITIIEHHILRDKNWRELSRPLFSRASKRGHSFVTAAEFLGERNNFLESRRRQLFENEPPTIEFQKWMKLPIKEKKLTKPPIQ